MAETAYERFLKDVKDDEAVDIEIRDPKPLDLDQVKLRIQNELAGQSKPKEPVKWLAMPEPKSILEMYYIFLVVVLVLDLHLLPMYCFLFFLLIL